MEMYLKTKMRFELKMHFKLSQFLSCHDSLGNGLVMRMHKAKYLFTSRFKRTKV